MLIINADDFGKTRQSTEKILSCFVKDRITSASAMVFMEDSERAAELAKDKGLECGLHLDFTLRFNGSPKLHRLNESLEKTASFLKSSKYSVLLYNPLLTREFEYLFKAQYEEFIRLYGKIPSHINGHQHFHLCMNVILASLIPVGSKIRRNFTFEPRDKNIFNRLYRYLADCWIMRRYGITDHFFDIAPISPKRMEAIVVGSKWSSVELMVHPERSDEYSYLMSDEFWIIMGDIQKGGYSHIQ